MRYYILLDKRWQCIQVLSGWCKSTICQQVFRKMDSNLPLWSVFLAGPFLCFQLTSKLHYLTCVWFFVWQASMLSQQSIFVVCIGRFLKDTGMQQAMCNLAKGFQLLYHVLSWSEERKLSYSRNEVASWESLIPNYTVRTFYYGLNIYTVY